MDNAIERFEKEHVNVQIEYISGIRKEDYSEWLSQQALSGDVCDVFMVLSNDLATFADVGILENLSSFIENDPDFDESVYFFSSYQSGQVNHVQYALPYESVPTLMYVIGLCWRVKVLKCLNKTGRGKIFMRYVPE